MSSTPKTIQIFLPGGNPLGIRVAEVTTRILQIIEVPRILLRDFLSMPESGQVALYFLVSASDDGTRLDVYVGQTGDLRARLAIHNRDKDFWQRALVLISRTHSLTQTHSLFLEWHSLQKIRAADRFKDSNGNSGSKPHTPAPLEADCLEIFETAHTLLATLGFRLFDPVVKESDTPTESDLMFAVASGADGRGIYTPEGFVVLHGSSGRKDMVPSMLDTAYAKAREPLLVSGILKVEGDRVVFTKDHLFTSPSAAAAVLLGRNANGWVEWKSKEGKTLDALKRQSPAL